MRDRVFGTSSGCGRAGTSAGSWLALVELARARLGSVSPRPAVGAVLVKRNRIVAAAGTEPGSGRHAERAAIEMAGGDRSRVRPLRHARTMRALWKHAALLQADHRRRGLTGIRRSRGPESGIRRRVRRADPGRYRRCNSECRPPRRLLFIRASSSGSRPAALTSRQSGPCRWMERLPPDRATRGISPASNHGTRCTRCARRPTPSW